MYYRFLSRSIQIDSLTEGAKSVPLDGACWPKIEPVLLGEKSEGCRADKTPVARGESEGAAVNVRAGGELLNISVTHRGVSGVSSCVYN